MFTLWRPLAVTTVISPQASEPAGLPWKSTWPERWGQLSAAFVAWIGPTLPSLRLLSAGAAVLLAVSVPPPQAVTTPSCE